MNGRSFSNGNSAYNGSGSTSPLSWGGGFESVEGYRSTWNGELGDPLYRQR